MDKNKFKLGVVRKPVSNQYQGALYINKPIRMGEDRWVLSFTTEKGYTTFEGAADAIHRKHPTLDKPKNISE